MRAKTKFFGALLPASLWLASILIFAGEAAPISLTPPPTVTFVFTSDVHYGISRGNFQGAGNVEARVVNAAMLKKINALPAATLPSDQGLHAGQPVGPIDFVVITGDITNRQELYPLKIQSAAISWAQFESGFVRQLSLKNRQGLPTPLFLVPGNHDVSNAIGASTRLVPATDATTLAEIYNRMMQPAVPKTKDTYRLATDRINYSRDVGGAHCVFLTVWPDSAERAWMEEDLKKVSPSQPVFLFCHDPPEPTARHFINPNGDHGINETDKFDNLLSDVYADGDPSAKDTVVEQRALAAFLKAHRNIVGFFHGHTNFTEFYTWKGPDGDLALAVFRADSPMKGNVSGKDETKLAFNVIVYDVAAQKLTARECLWNVAPDGVAWGALANVSLAVH